MTIYVLCALEIIGVLGLALGLRRGLWWVGTIWLAANLLLKMALAQVLFPVAIKLSVYAWCWNLVDVALGVSVVYLLVSKRLLGAWLWGTATFFSVLFWGDIIYYRYFGDLLNVYLMIGSSQLFRVYDSVLALTHPSDLWLLADLVPASVVLVSNWEKCEWTSRYRKRLVVGLLGVGVIFNVAMYCALPSVPRIRLQKRFKNITVARILGLWGYHVYDVVTLGRRFIGEYTAYDESMIRDYITASRESITEETTFRGIFKNKNVVMLQLESCQDFLLGLRIGGQEVTPTLNRLAGEGIYVKLWDQSGLGRSSDGEFALLNSLHPPTYCPLCFAYPDNDYYALPAILRRVGYHTVYVMPSESSFWNARHMSWKYGFEERLFQEDFSEHSYEEATAWGLKDDALYRRLVPRMARMEKPFLVYVVTLFGHHPFQEYGAEGRALHLPSDLEGTTLADYLRSWREKDRMLNELLAGLERYGLLDSTVLVLVGDHDAGLGEDEMKLLIKDYRKFWYDTVPMVIWTPGGPTWHTAKPAGQIDLAPTLLHLLGVTQARPVFLGRNIFSEKRWKPVISGSGYAIGMDYGVDCSGDSPKPRVANKAEALQTALHMALHNELMVSKAILWWNAIPVLRRSLLTQLRISPQKNSKHIIPSNR